MTVPETPMHENDLTLFGKDNVRFPRQILTMQSVPIPQAMKNPTYGHFRACMSRSDRLHDRTALLRRTYIYH